MTQLLDPASALFPQGKPFEMKVRFNPHAWLLRGPFISDALRHQILTFNMPMTLEQAQQAMRGPRR